MSVKTGISSLIMTLCKEEVQASNLLTLHLKYGSGRISFDGRKGGKGFEVLNRTVEVHASSTVDGRGFGTGSKPLNNPTAPPIQ